MTQVTNAKMVQAMQDSKGVPSKFLPQVLELRDEYHRGLLDHIRTRNRALAAKAAARKGSGGPAGPSPEAEEVDQYPAAVSLGRSLMNEVIMALLQRGLSISASVDQLDIANNHFNAGIVWPRQPSDFALEDGDLDGFGPVVTKLSQKGFVCVNGLLDDEIASSIHDECKTKFWDCRDAGAMRPSGGSAVDGYECWLPYPARRGTSPELEHALRVLFGLPHELQRNGYLSRLKVPTMAHLGCFLPGTGQERLHLDNPLSTRGGRELTFLFFCSPGWMDGDGGAFRAYMQADDDCPAPRPKAVQAADSAEVQATATKSEADEHEDHFKDFDPEPGTCLIFRSRELWHEMLVTNKMQFALTLFVQLAD